jgi:uncharacterized membrane protein
MSVPDHVNESIEAIAQLHGRAESSVNRHQRGVERLAQVLGRPSFLYLWTLLAIAWIATNWLGPSFGMRTFDPAPFGMLQTVLTIAALFIATMVLIVQNRQSMMAEKRSTLDLQINLLAERKAAKIISLLEELRRDLPTVSNRHDSEAQEMSTALDPKSVADALERSMESAEEQATEARVEAKKQAR